MAAVLMGVSFVFWCLVDPAFVWIGDRLYPHRDRTRTLRRPHEAEDVVVSEPACPAETAAAPDDAAASQPKKKRRRWWLRRWFGGYPAIRSGRMPEFPNQHEDE
jgi:hypothetical protein